MNIKLNDKYDSFIINEIECNTPPIVELYRNKNSTCTIKFIFKDCIIFINKYTKYFAEDILGKLGIEHIIYYSSTGKVFNKSLIREVITEDYTHYKYVKDKA